MYDIESIAKHFESAAIKHPSLRLIARHGDAGELRRQERYISEVLIPKLTRNRPIIESAGLNGEWQFDLCGDQSAALDFLDLATEAGALLADNPIDFLPAGFDVRSNSEITRQLGWCAALFGLAWASERGSPVAADDVQFGGPNGVVEAWLSVLPMNPFRASALLIERLNSDHRKRTTIGERQGDAGGNDATTQAPPVGYIAASQAQYEFGITPPELSRLAHADPPIVRRCKAPEGYHDSNGKRVRTLYHRGDIQKLKR